MTYVNEFLSGIKTLIFCLNYKSKLSIIVSKKKNLFQKSGLQIKL